MDEVDTTRTCVFCDEILEAKKISKHIAENHLNIVLKHLIERYKEESNELLIQKQVNEVESKIKELQIKESLEKTLTSNRETDYPCLKCEKGFRSKACLMQHDRHVHQKIRYPCDKCKVPTLVSTEMA